MMRTMLYAATLALLATGPTMGQLAKPPAPIPSGNAEDREAEIYQATRSALANARGRANSKDLSVRKAALARETSAAMAGVSTKFGITARELEQVMLRGQALDGTAARREEAASKSLAKARNQAMLGTMGATPRPSGFRPGISSSDRNILMRGTGMIPAEAPDRAAPSAAPLPSGESHTGPRGGVYHYSASGKKVYEKMSK